MTTGNEAGGVAAETVFCIYFQVLNFDLAISLLANTSAA